MGYGKSSTKWVMVKLSHHVMAKLNHWVMAKLNHWVMVKLNHLGFGQTQLLGYSKAQTLGYGHAQPTGYGQGQLLGYGQAQPVGWVPTQQQSHGVRWAGPWPPNCCPTMPTGLTPRSQGFGFLFPLPRLLSGAQTRRSVPKDVGVK